MPDARRWGRAITAGSVVAIAGLTLAPDPGAAASAAKTGLLCLICGDRGGVDVVLNVILFVPLGLGLRLAGVPLRRAVGVAAVCSFTVELLQLTVVTGRDASLSDILTNTTGAGLGTLVVPRLGLLLCPDHRQGGRLLLGGVTAWLALLLVSAWLLSPDFGDGEVGGAWADIPGPEVFTGRVLEVRSAGALLPRSGAPRDSAGVRQALRQGRMSLEARVVTGLRSPARRWIYIIGENGVPRLDLSQQGRALLLGLPARAQHYLFGTPTILLPKAFPPDTGREVALEATMSDRIVRLAATSGDTTRSETAALSPARGWTLFAPFGLGLGPRVPLLTSLVLLGLTLPLGYWAARAPWLPGGLMLGTALVAGLGGIPAVTGFPPVALSEWAGAVGGAAAGWALSRAAAYLQPRCGSPSTAEFSSS